MSDESEILKLKMSLCTVIAEFFLPAAGFSQEIKWRARSVQANTDTCTSVHRDLQKDRERERDGVSLHYATVDL